MSPPVKVSQVGLTAYGQTEGVGDTDGGTVDDVEIANEDSAAELLDSGSNELEGVLAAVDETDSDVKSVDEESGVDEATLLTELDNTVREVEREVLVADDEEAMLHVEEKLELGWEALDELDAAVVDAEDDVAREVADD